MADLFVNCFWETSTALVALIVPLIALWAIFDLVGSLLFGRS